MQNSEKIRTRFAPSPTGFLHIGSLRTALYDFLFARKNNGKFILRIDDTDRERYVPEAEENIYKNLKWAGLTYDEGPDVGGDYGPYIQSRRLDIYKKYAEELAQKGHAYYCFCSKERLEDLRKEQQEKHEAPRYDRLCRDLTAEEVKKKLTAKTPYVIRQKIPLEGTSSFEDLVFGKIEVKNNELEDQILLKSDEFPTYNFANVVDDHLLEISHIIRGSEFLPSTPKFNLLYEAFSWPPPLYIHLPVITDEQHRKLSKRSGDVALDDFIAKGYTKDAIINYIALLGWNPGTDREIFTLDELIKEFSVEKINKSPAVFDYKKLNWLNGYYLRQMPFDEFHEFIKPFYTKKRIPLSPRQNSAQIFTGEGTKPQYSISPLFNGGQEDSLKKISRLLHERVEVPADIPDMIDFFFSLPDYDFSLFIHKKSKTDIEMAKNVLIAAAEIFTKIETWNSDSLKNAILHLTQDMGLKTGQTMWPIRAALSGKEFTPGGAPEIADILGKNETLDRIKIGLNKIEKK